MSYTLHLLRIFPHLMYWKCWSFDGGPHAMRKRLILEEQCWLLAKFLSTILWMPPFPLLRISYRKIPFLWFFFTGSRRQFPEWFHPQLRQFHIWIFTKKWFYRWALGSLTSYRNRTHWCFPRVHISTGDPAKLQPLCLSLSVKESTLKCRSWNYSAEQRQLRNKTIWMPEKR